MTTAVISSPPPPDSRRSLRRATYPQVLHHSGGHDPHFWLYRMQRGEPDRANWARVSNGMQTGSRIGMQRPSGVERSPPPGPPHEETNYLLAPLTTKSTSRTLQAEQRSRRHV